MVAQKQPVAQAQLDAGTLAALAQEEMDIYEKSRDPRERKSRIHNAFAYLYRLIEPKAFVPKAEPGRLRFLRLGVESMLRGDGYIFDTYIKYLFE